MPPARRRFLGEAMLSLARCRKVDVNIVASLMGLWVFGAILNRNILSITFHVYKFIERDRDSYIISWPSVREELVAMGNATVYMHCCLDHSLLQYIFATDAQGAGEGDYGGY